MKLGFGDGLLALTAHDGVEFVLAGIGGIIYAKYLWLQVKN